MSESQEHTLKVRERLSLQLHLMICSGCNNFNEQMGTIRQMSHEYAKARDPKSEEE